MENAKREFKNIPDLYLSSQMPAAQPHKMKALQNTRI